ncbi:MAG: hypothetical protein ACXWB2_10865 [Acidimicrobiales bacterium]
MLQGSRATALLGGIACLVLSSCVHNVTGPVRTPTTYEHKAAATAGTAASSVATVDLAMQTAQGGDAFATYLSVLISNAEDELGAATSTFSAIQPPDDSSLTVRAELLDILDGATDAVAAARIAVRNSTDADAAQLIDALNQSTSRLQDFEIRYR